jgi:osmoprotectant transport system permease protein
VTQFDFGRLLHFWETRGPDIVGLVVEHISVVAVSLLIAMIIGVGVGMLVWDRPLPRSTVIAAAGVALTIPSLAMLALLIPTFGLGWTPTIIALVMYSLLPIVRNTVVGLREVAPAVMESATGMGMNKFTVLFRVQLPIAWPIILTGVRVAAQLTIGVAAIAAYVAWHLHLPGAFVARLGQRSQLRSHRNSGSGTPRAHRRRTLRCHHPLLHVKGTPCLKHQPPPFCRSPATPAVPGSCSIR